MQLAGGLRGIRGRGQRRADHGSDRRVRRRRHRGVADEVRDPGDALRVRLAEQRLDGPIAGARNRRAIGDAAARPAQASNGAAPNNPPASWHRT